MRQLDNLSGSGSNNNITQQTQSSSNRDTFIFSVSVFCLLVFSPFSSFFFTAYKKCVYNIGSTGSSCSSRLYANITVAEGTRKKERRG
jgi:hypothetical protein